MAAPRCNFEIPELFPQPKHLTLTEGQSELGADVRLGTSNVLPIQRKAVRSILTASGVRVVANKKKFVVEARVDPEDLFDFSDVPDRSRRDYYELEIKGSEVNIRSPHQEGMVWASQTLAGIFRLVLAGHAMPNMTIRDWPILPVRGIFVENKWGPDRMLAADWFQMIDSLSGNKMNTLGIGLYGCWGECRFEGSDRPTEFLMIPPPAEEFAGLQNEHRLRWYTISNDIWHDELYQPATVQRDFLLEIITYGRERGVEVIPFFNSLGHNTLIPRVYPEVSARDAKNKPTGMNYCTSAPATRTFLEKFYGAIIEKYYHNVLEYFHVELDEVWDSFPHPGRPLKKEAAWCACPACAKKTPGELFCEHLLWLVGMLVSKGVKKVVVWNDQLTRHSQLLDADLVQRLEAAGLKDKLIIHWWYYSNDKIVDSVRPRLGSKLGLAGWVAPMTCYYNWVSYDYRRPNIEKMAKIAESDGAEGAVAYAVHDPSHFDHEALLAAYAWESTAVAGTPDKVQKRWSANHFGPLADSYVKAVEKLAAASRNPAYVLCRPYTYCYTRAGLPAWPRPYPEEALNQLLALDGAGAALAEAAAQADDALQHLAILTGQESVTPVMLSSLQSLAADAARIKAMAQVFAWLVTLKADLNAAPTARKCMVTACEKVRAEFLEQLRFFESNKVAWIVPASMQPLSHMLRFLDILRDELKKSANRKKPLEFSWTLPENWEVPELT